MKLRRHVLLILLALYAVGGIASAAEPETKNYLLFVVKTPLQQNLVSLSNADAYVQIDVGGCLHDGKFDPTRLEAQGFREALANLARQAGKVEPGLAICYRHTDFSLDPKETQAMERAVAAICREVGFARSGTNSTFERESWADKVARFAALADETNPTESPVENDVARAYPVETQLSRFLLRDAEADCYIGLRQAIDGRLQGFLPETRQAIGECVTKLQLRQTRHVTFFCVCTTAGEPWLMRAASKSPGPLAKELGFRAGTWISSRMTVEPEKLLGKPAPDFTLDALAGGQIHLQELIRGRVAVIAFLGVACGPCCKEAPHLTALYNQYRDKGLAVVAVNAYDESKQVVERFARSEGLTHPVALKGSEVAADKYTVASYPVTFLVDHTGAIADYRLGFGAGDEKLLAKAIGRLLAEREKATLKR
jgi:peroxiredoxin